MKRYLLPIIYGILAVIIILIFGILLHIDLTAVLRYLMVSDVILFVVVVAIGITLGFYFFHSKKIW
jgi:hypothetical protein